VYPTLLQQPRGAGNAVDYSPQRRCMSKRRLLTPETDTGRPRHPSGKVRLPAPTAILHVDHDVHLKRVIKLVFTFIIQARAQATAVPEVLFRGRQPATRNATTQPMAAGAYREMKSLMARVTSAGYSACRLWPACSMGCRCAWGLQWQVRTDAEWHKIIGNNWQNATTARPS
jgi:hypothetical protein